MHDDLELTHLLATLIEYYFRDSGRGLVYALLSGSFAYGGAIKGQSDIDLQLVFTPVAAVNKQRIKEPGRLFLADFSALVTRFGYLVDHLFPVEFVTTEQIDDAIRGRGFHVSDMQQLYLPQASDAYYLADSERWYRAWLSQTAFGRCIVGNCTSFLSKKTEAWQTIILFLLSSSITPTSISAQTIISLLMSETNKWNGIGVSQRYVNFHVQELEVVTQALHKLSNDGYLVQDGDSYFLNVLKIDDWQRDLAQSITGAAIRSAKDFFVISDMEDIKAASASTPDAITN